MSGDPCQTLGAERRSAILWFLVVFLFAVALTVKLAGIDRWMYDHHGETLNIDKFRENRLAGTTISSEHSDFRTEADYSSIVKKLK